MPVSGYAYNSKNLQNTYCKLLAFSCEGRSNYVCGKNHSRYALQFRLKLAKQGSSVQSIIKYLGKEWLFDSVRHFLMKGVPKPLPKKIRYKGSVIAKDFRGRYNGLKFSDYFTEIPFLLRRNWKPSHVFADTTSLSNMSHDFKSGYINTWADLKLHESYSDSIVLTKRIETLDFKLF